MGGGGETHLSEKNFLEPVKLKRVHSIEVLDSDVKMDHKVSELVPFIVTKPLYTSIGSTNT